MKFKIMRTIGYVKAILKGPKFNPGQEVTHTTTGDKKTIGAVVLDRNLGLWLYTTTAENDKWLYSESLLSA